MSTTKSTFKPIELGFNETGFNSRILELESGILNDISQGIESIKELGLKFTDLQLRAFFLEGEINPGDILTKFFNNVASKFEREHQFQEYLSELRTIHRIATDSYSYNNNVKYIQFREGKVFLNPEAVEEIKKGFISTLESERAKEIYDLYDEVFHKAEKLMNLIHEKNSLIHFNSIFQLDQDWKLKKRDLAFNIL